MHAIGADSCRDSVWPPGQLNHQTCEPGCRQSWVVQQAMLVLEHATFAAPKNEAALVGLSMPRAPAAEWDGSNSGSIGAADARSAPELAGDSGEPFPQWLVRTLTGATCAAADSQPAVDSANDPQVPSHFAPCRGHAMSLHAPGDQHALTHSTRETVYASYICACRTGCMPGYRC